MNLKRNRLFTLFLAALMLLTTLAGGLAALAEGSVELTVVTSYGGDDGNRKNYEAAVAAYEEATGNTVLDASSTSNEEWKARVLTDFETGTEPDVLFFFTNADAEPFINACLLYTSCGGMPFYLRPEASQILYLMIRWELGRFVYHKLIY